MSSALRHHRDRWIWYLLASVAVVIGFPLVPEPYAAAELLTATIGAIWAIAFFRNSRHAEDARFLKELMQSFNKRYDEMNDDLRTALDRGEAFDSKERLRFIDYFNLCAEEWLFWKMGYITEPVWKAWRNGMCQYAGDSRVQALWERERSTESHYGLEFPSAGLHQPSRPADHGS